MPSPAPSTPAPREPILLDATYRARAIPAGSARYWSWLFAAPEIRDALLGVYGLAAELKAQFSPDADLGVARIKLQWWRAEIERFALGASLHPLFRHLAAVPGVAAAHVTVLNAAVDAAEAEISGVPLESGADLEAHAAALEGDVWTLASQMAESRFGDSPSLPDVRACASKLAAGRYIAAAIRDYRRLGRAGRVPFPVDELLAAGVENADLCAESAPPHLARYLETLRSRADEYHRMAGGSLDAPHRSRHRHLLILAALGVERLEQGERDVRPRVGRRALRDMLLAWRTARGAQR